MCCARNSRTTVVLTRNVYFGGSEGIRIPTSSVKSRVCYPLNTTDPLVLRGSGRN